METTTLNPAIRGIPMPPGVAALPVDPRGFPVPWFVAWVDSKPEFRCADPEKLVRAVRLRLCWVCGRHLGPPHVSPLAFVIGPMCSVNRISAEPPCHPECAAYSVRACPFLSRPHMTRREEGLPEDTSHAGYMIRRNPGAGAVWECLSYRLVGDGAGKALFRIGDPTRVTWWAEGRPATRAEVLASIDSGLPLLLGPAEEDGPGAVALLRRMHAAAMRYLPADPAVGEALALSIDPPGGEG